MFSGQVVSLVRFALTLIIAVLAVSDAFAIDMSLAPGLSVKNAVLYAVAGTLLLRGVVLKDIRLQMGVLRTCFITWIGYAVLTTLLDAFVVHLPHYRVVESVILLKSVLVDSAIVFFVFFYGLRSIDDAIFITKIVLMGLAFGNVVSIADVSGLIGLGVTEVGTYGAEAGRVFGAFGHANETAALIAILLPAYFSAVLMSRGVARIGWVGASLASAAMLILTGSRGGFVAVVVGGIWGTTLCRRYLSARVLLVGAAAVVATAIILVPIVSLVGTGLAGTFVERLIEIDPSEGGSDRTGIWQRGIEVMMSFPVAVVTGFGWNSWFAKGFPLAAHNQYLWLWFELGLIGLGSYLGIIWQSLSTARFAIQYGSERTRPYLIAFVFGLCTLTVAVFFVQLSKPWPYIWAYAAASCRIAVDTIEAQRQSKRQLRRGSSQGPGAIAMQSVGATQDKLRQDG